jgi:hypothetical protein
VLPDPLPDDTADDELNRALQAGLDEIRADEHRRAEELRGLIAEAATARGWTDQQLTAHFNAWPGATDPLDKVSFVVLADYLEYLQRTRVN